MYRVLCAIEHKDQTLDIFIKSMVSLKISILQIWVTWASKITLINLQLCSIKIKGTHTPCDVTRSRSIPLLLEMTNADLQYWMTSFIMEVRKKDGSSFPPNTLHHICCGIMRHLRTNGKPFFDFIKNPEFADFRPSIDAEMKRLQAAGLGSKRKQAELLTREEVEKLWEKGLLGGVSKLFFSKITSL